MRAARIALALLLALAAPLAGQRFAWQPGDRVLIGALGELGAVAVGPRHVYAAGPAGVVVYDLLREAWAPPLPLAADMPLGEQPTALAYDRLSDALWLGTASGTVHTYTLGFDRWERVGPITPGPVLFVAPAGDGVYIAGRDGWRILRRGGFIADPVPEGAVPPDVRARAAQRLGGGGRDVWLDAARATLGLDPALRRWPITDVAAGERPGESWLATGGGGLLRHDARRMAAEWLPIGLPSRGAGAILVDGDDVWLGANGAGASGGIARTSEALDRWSVYLAGDGAPRGLVREMVRIGDALWVAAADGLFRLDIAASEGGAPARGVWLRITAADGLPGDRVTSIAAADDGLWVATTQGITWVDARGNVAPFSMAPGRSFARVALVGDTLWAASDAGLLVVPGARSPSVRPGGLVNVPQARVPGAFAAPGDDLHPALRGPVLEVAADGATLVAATPTGIFTRTDGVWSGPRRVADEAGIGRVARMRLSAEGLWLAGERGAALLDAATGVLTRYLVPADIPAGPVADAAPAGEHVWLATPAGALRLRVRR